MVDYDADADWISNEMLHLIEQIRQESPSWHMADQWRRAMAKYGTLYAQFQTAVVNAQVKMGSAERDFDMLRARMSAEYHSRVNLERRARP